MSRRMRPVRPGDVIHLPDGDHTVDHVTERGGIRCAISTDGFAITLHGATGMWPDAEMTQFHIVMPDIEGEQ